MGHTHEHQDSGNTEFYTPLVIVDAARVALGGHIDLDPASCEIANREVRARYVLTREEDGLLTPWSGRVWLNHPFERGKNGRWINKLVNEYLFGDVTAACCITWANIAEGWFRPLLGFPQCFPNGRIHYMLPDGTVKKGAPKGSIITYLGPDPEQFARAFREIGTCKIPY